MKKLAKLLAIISLLSIVACDNDSESSQSRKTTVTTRDEEIRATESALAKATNGTPLSIPIISESGFCVFVIPVTNHTHRIDRVFLLDCTTTKDVDYECDLFQLDTVYTHDNIPYQVAIRTITGEKRWLTLDDDNDSFIFDVYEINRLYPEKSNILIPIAEDDMP